MQCSSCWASASQQTIIIGKEVCKELNKRVVDLFYAKEPKNNYENLILKTLSHSFNSRGSLHFKWSEDEDKNNYFLPKKMDQEIISI
jgi:hypothetical protein